MLKKELMGTTHGEGIMGPRSVPQVNSNCQFCAGEYIVESEEGQCLSLAIAKFVLVSTLWKNVE